MSEQASKQEPLLITATQVAELLSVSKRTLYRLISAGEFPRPIRIGASSRWRKAAVKEWIDARIDE